MSFWFPRHAQRAKDAPSGADFFFRLAESMTGIVYAATPGGNTEYVNPRWLAYTGQVAGGRGAREWESAIHPDDLRELRRRWREVVTGGAEGFVTLRLRRRDGAYRWHRMSIVPQRERGEGRTLRCFGMLVDVQHERSNEFSLRLLRDLLRRTPTMLFTCDARGDVDFVNARWTEMLGCDEAALLGRGWLDFLHPEDRPRMAERRDRSGAPVEAWSAHVRVRRVDGTYRWVEIKMEPHRAPEGALVGWYGAGNDVDLQHRAMAAAELLAEKSGATVNAAQDVDRILEAIARASLEGVGDVSLFDLLDDQGGTTRRMVASRNVHAVSAAAFEAFRSPLEPGHPLAAPLRAGQSCSASILDDEYIVRHLTESERRAAWRATEMGSIVVAPLQVFGRTLGALTVLRMQPNLPFDSSDTQVVEEIARRAAVAIDNIRVADGARKAAELHERHMRAFAKIGESLSESLGLRQTLDAALQIAVPEYADAGWITLAEGEGDLRLAAVSHTAPGASPSLERQVGNLYARAAQHHVGSIAAMRTREPVLYGEMTYELAAAMLDREIVDAVFECVAVSSVLIVPLIVDSLPRGTMVLCAARERGHRFEPADVPFFQELARRIAPAIGNAEAFERERRVARTFQRAALPAGLPNAAGYSFFAVYETGRSEALVGGDWYDAFCLSDGCIVLSIGDVAGSGLEAAVIMSNVRQTIRGVAQVQADPALMLASADSALREERPDRFVTAFVAVIDPISRSIDYASAGHPPPLLRMPDGTIVELDGARGLPLGLHDGYGGVATAHLPPASLLVLFTDGLVEATHDFAAGERRLRDAVASLDTSQVPDPARALRDRILDEAPRDDAAILVVQALERDAPSTWTINPREPRATNDARLQISRSLAVGGYAVELLPTAELIVAELVGNLARHAPGPAEISLEWNAGQPVLHVRDRGPGFDFVPKLPPDVYAESGRGLYLISALAREFAVARRPDGGSDVRVVLRS